ncbi:uncharacterized protein LOC116296865 [Actinia tenebrosa]|uniref:Uncharacterized protein LOC116296865 n=1 Tax=Actinia tenebrosa TaxID=6105 RepID=A0A6P8I714_ACTTE|nr:uncharacterized protein LOC116296865 [Actinia tenebrosa]
METNTPESIEVKLENKDLWAKFNTLGTEMVITKAGRRMFPFLEVSIKGLHPDETYMVILDITLVDDRRYKYNERENHWQIVDSRLLSPTPVGMFVHPVCPCSGKEVCAQPMSFNKVKLTNNYHKVPFGGHILLESMGRYVPRLSIVTYHDYYNQSWEKGVAFMFRETEFITVTAYMNKEITKLKIDNNPFARGFRENGLKWKVLHDSIYGSDVNSIDYENDQMADESRETEAPLAMTYLSNEEDNDDGIQVFHVNPSSIIVTDVLPSLPSTSCLITSTNFPSSSSKISTNSEEVNVVFEPVHNASTDTRGRVGQTSSYEAEKTGLDSLLYSRSPLQSITVDKSQFITSENSGGKSNSSDVWVQGIVGDDAEEDILCKVSDVRSIKEAPLPSDKQENTTRMLSSLECEENVECFSDKNEEGYSKDKCERIASETTTNSLKNEENCLAEEGKLAQANKDSKCVDNNETFVGKNENYFDQMRNGDGWDDNSPSDNSSELTRKTIDIQDVNKDKAISLTEGKLVHENTVKETQLNDFISACDERIAIGNEECNSMEDDVEERNSRDAVDARPSEKVQEQQNKKVMSSNAKEYNSSQGNVDIDNVKEFTLNGEYRTENTSKPQISKLLNFVNSVSMPVLKFGAEKETLSSNKDTSDSLLKKSPEKLAYLGKKRPVDDRPGLVVKKGRLMNQLNEGVKSLDQSSNVFSSINQSKDSLKSLDQSDKRLRSVSHSNVILKSMGQSKESLESLNQSDKRLKSMNHSSDILKSVDQSERNLKSVHRLSGEVTKPTKLPNNSGHHQNKKLHSSISSLTPLRDNTKKEFCNERSPRFESKIFQEQRANHETSKERPEDKISMGIRTTVINVGHEELAKPLVANGLHPRNSLYRTKYIEKFEARKERGSALQRLSQVNSTRNEDPSCMEKDGGMRHVVGNQNEVLVESVSMKSLPVILSSYSIHPSNFSNQKIIDLNNETRVDENRVPKVYPAESFLLKENTGKDVHEKCPIKTDPRCQPILGEEKRDACVHPGKSKSFYRKIIPKPMSLGSQHSLSKQQEFIDLNSQATFYQRQADNPYQSYYANKGVPLQVLYTFETRMSLSRAPDPRLPEVYNPTRTTFTGYASNLICSTLPIATNMGFSPAAPGKYY